MGVGFEELHLRLMFYLVELNFNGIPIFLQFRLVRAGECYGTALEGR